MTAYVVQAIGYSVLAYGLGSLVHHGVKRQIKRTRGRP